MMQIAVRRVHLGLVFAVAALGTAARAQSGKLVVFVVVDQLRYQDLLWAREQFGRGGFGGLGQPLPGPYRTALTHTAPDHPTLSTGTYTDRHRVLGNSPLADGQVIEAIEDPD